jgi:hypothetical protein
MNATRALRRPMPCMTWSECGVDAGVLKLERPAIELVIRRCNGSTLAWWTDRYGRLLRLATLGLA